MLLVEVLHARRPRATRRDIFGNVHFFFQAEDGIRDTSVTGVQTCALPIFDLRKIEDVVDEPQQRARRAAQQPDGLALFFVEPRVAQKLEEPEYRVHRRPDLVRSEERRVGKEW